jgi:hypothetical protein
MDKGLHQLESLFSPRICFQVPVFQRNYSWDEKQWTDLWNDLYYLETGKIHYFGTIILMEKGKKPVAPGVRFEEFGVVDGQQRMTTTLILLSEILRQLEAVGDLTEENLRKLKEDWLRFQSIYKLELLGDDREFFRRYIIDGEKSPSTSLTPSQDRLNRAKVFFKTKFEDLQKQNPEEFRKFPALLMEKIEEMEVMVYPLKETSEAARMFELVNDRGKILTNLEKTKSYLMYMIYLAAPSEEQERYLRDLNDRFGNIYRWIAEIQRTACGQEITEDSIQRYHFITYATKEMLPDYVTRAEASYDYSAILKNNIIDKYRKDKKECLALVLNYTKELENAYSVFRDLLTYNMDEETRVLLEKILLLGRAANFYPLLEASWVKFKDDPEKVREILRLIEIIAFRIYAIGKRRADSGRPTLYDLAFKIKKGIITFPFITEELKGLAIDYEPDNDFLEDLKDVKFYGRVTGTDKRYLLYHYETSLRKAAMEPIEFTLAEVLSRDEYGKPKYEIEHIWPQDTGKLGLDDAGLKEHEANLNRLGNLTLAAKGWNASMGNDKFEDKCVEYKKSLFRVQTELVNYGTWGKTQIDQREGKLLKFALEKWKI